jgi:multidrug efflux pump subunit AcrB
VRNNAGGLIQLSSLVNRKEGVSPNIIERYNRLRSTTISGTPIDIPLGTAIERTEAILAEDFPAGFLYDWTGEAESLRTANHEAMVFLIMALIIVYMVLASQFESLIHPVTIILTVPLATVGALGLLWLLQALGTVGVIKPIPAMTINLFSQVGFILLIGLVTKNAILLVEFANQMKEQGMNAHEAMLKSGSVRLRPILMTACSTIAGMLPIALGFGDGAESRAPMGACVVGGMITSTVLTLVVIPVVYSLVDDVTQWILAVVRNRRLPLSPRVADAQPLKHSLTDIRIKQGA